MRIIFLAMALSLLAGCSSLVEVVAPSEVIEPAELQSFEPKIDIATLWRRSVDSDPDYLHLKPAWSESRLYVAGSNGQVSALDARTGNTFWQVELDVPLSAGPGVGEGLVLLGTSDAEVIALAISTGELVWRAKMTSEVLAVPLAAHNHVVVRTLDGALVGLDIADGSVQWRYLRDIPALTLRGVSSPVLSGLNVLYGMDGGKLVALDIRTGQPAWESTIALSMGRSELDRMVDIDGDPIVYEDQVYVNAYQGAIVALNQSSGNALWRRGLSSYNRPAAEGKEVYAADAEGVVWAFDRQTGTALWRQELFQRRQLSDVAILGNFVVVGDYEGYIHFLSRQDGTQAARARVGTTAIRKGIISVDNVLYVQSDTGQLQALVLDF